MFAAPAEGPQGRATAGAAIAIPNAAEQLKQRALFGRCCGRVGDLEAMVPAQWWKEVFADAIYLKTDGDVVEDPEITREEVAMLEANADVHRVFVQGRAPGEEPARVLDLCCGQGRHLLHLAREFPHLQLYGHDQSSYLIGLAQERAAAAGVAAQTRFTVGDCRQIPYGDDMFDLVLVMGNSFGYFATDDGDRVVLEAIRRVLKPGGRMILDLTDGGYMRANFAERSWEWVDDMCFVCRERQLSRDGKRLNSREVVTITNRGVVRDQFYQERLYDRSEVEELVRSCGLVVERGGKGGAAPRSAEACRPSVITIAGELSKRKEDLGMMECRLLVEALKPGAATFGDDVELSPASAGQRPAMPHIIDSMSAGSCSSASTLTASVAAPVAKVVAGIDAEAVTLSPARIPTVTAPAVWATPLLPKPASVALARVAVLLGDPTRACVGKLNDTWNAEDMATREKLLVALEQLGLVPDDSLLVLADHEALVANLSNLKSDGAPVLVFNLCDEGLHNDALRELHVPALLETLNLAYSGAGPNCLGLCYDKGLVNRTADALGIPTPRETYYFADHACGDANMDLANVKALIAGAVGYPAFLKPLKGDNSLGITARSIVRDEAELETYLAELRALGIRDVIIQEYLDGTEYGVGMVGNAETGFHFFPILEVDYSAIVARRLPPILGFESKWDPASPYWSEIKYQQAQLDAGVEAQLKRHCVVLWERFGCRDYARFDFRCDRGRGDGRDGRGGSIKLLEVNPNPGWCWDGKFAYMAKLDGYSYSDMLGMVLHAASLRCGRDAAA